MLHRRTLIGGALAAAGTCLPYKASAANSGASEQDKERIFDSPIRQARSGRPIFSLNKIGENPFNSAAFSPDGALIATTGAPNVCIWDGVTGKLIKVLKGHRRQVYTCDFSPDGRRLVTSSSDQTVCVWDVASGGLYLILPHHKLVFDAAFSPDGRFIVTSPTGRIVRIWDATSGAQITTIEQHGDGAYIDSARFCANGEWLLTTALDDRVRIWDVKSRRQIQAFHVPDLRTAALSTDGTRLVTTSLYSNKATIRDTATGSQLAELRAHKDWLSSAVFNADGTRVITGSADETARIWDAGSGDELMVLPSGEYSSFATAFSRDEKRVLTVGFDQVTVWDIT